MVAQHNALMRASGLTFLGLIGASWRKAEAHAIDWRGPARSYRAARRADDAAAICRMATYAGWNRARHVHRAGAALPRRTGRRLNARESGRSANCCCRSALIGAPRSWLIEHDMSVVMEISTRRRMTMASKIAEGRRTG